MASRKFDQPQDDCSLFLLDKPASRFDQTMPAYHSQFVDTEIRLLGNILLLPLKSRIRGPAPTLADTSGDDIIDETIDLFRANVLFKNFEIKSHGDRLLIYLTLFLSECLSKIQTKMSFGEAQKVLQTHAVSPFALPGESGSTLSALYQLPPSRQDLDVLRQYIQQCRQELVTRFLLRLYPQEANTPQPSKWWLCFQRRKFMNKSL